jgi:Flp pilus assembly protein protease CpaA
MKILLFVLLTVCSVMDIRSLYIPPSIVIPATVAGCIMTGNILSVVIILGVGGIMFSYGLIGGGDVKLLMMIAAFIGWVILPVFLLSRVLLWGARKFSRYQGVLPYAPFLQIATICFLWGVKM